MASLKKTLFWNLYFQECRILSNVKWFNSHKTHGKLQQNWFNLLKWSTIFSLNWSSRDLLNYLNSKWLFVLQRSLGFSLQYFVNVKLSSRYGCLCVWMSRFCANANGFYAFVCGNGRRVEDKRCRSPYAPESGISAGKEGCVSEIRLWMAQLEFKQMRMNSLTSCRWTYWVSAQILLWCKTCCVKHQKRKTHE